MLIFISRRLATMVPLMLVVSVVVFLFLHMIPGDPARVVAGPEANEQDVEATRIVLGLDRPLYEQYWRFVSNAVQGDLGQSYRTREKVLSVLADRIGPTLKLSAASMVWAVIAGMFFGVVAATKRGKWLKIFYHPQVPIVAKKEMVQKLFRPVLANFVGNFLLLLIDKRRESLLPYILEEYERLADKAGNVCKVAVTTALPLTEGQTQAFVAKLSGLTGCNIELLTTVDKRLLGGAVLQIGDKRVDGSILSHLDQLKAILLKKEATGIEVAS